MNVNPSGRAMSDPVASKPPRAKRGAITMVLVPTEIEKIVGDQLSGNFLDCDVAARLEIADVHTAYVRVPITKRRKRKPKA